MIHYHELKIKNIGFGVFVFISVLLAGIIGMEVISQIFLIQWVQTPADRNYWMYDAQLGWKHRPGQEGILRHRDFKMEIKINSHGLRDREHAYQKDANKKRLLILGDSFGWGFGVNVQQRFSEILEKYHPEWEIINSSVSGYGTDQEYLFLKNEGLKYQPDAILLLFCCNDFENNSSREQYWHNKPMGHVNADNEFVIGPETVPLPSLKQKVGSVVILKTHFIAQLCRLLKRWVDPDTGKNEPFSREAVELTNKILLAIHEIAKRNHSRFYVVSVPMMQPLRKELERSLAGADIPYLPLDEAFDRYATEPVTFKHDGHWNTAGHALAARAINEFLEANGE